MASAMVVWMPESGKTIKEIDREIFEAAVELCRTNEEVARMTGLTLRTVYRRLAEMRAEEGGN